MASRVALVAVFCALICIVVADKNNNKEEKKTACEAKSLTKIEACCQIPKILKPESFVGCGEVFAETQKQYVQAKQKQKAAKKSGKGARKGKNDKAEEKAQEDDNRGGVLCLMECVLRNQTLLTADGKPDVAKIEEQFTNVADLTWKPIVKRVITECNQQTENAALGTLPTPPPGIKSCTADGALYMACVRRGLALSCPDSILNNDKECQNNMSILKNCNPLELAGARKGKNGKKARAGKSGKKTHSGRKSGEKKAAKKAGE